MRTIINIALAVGFLILDLCPVGSAMGSNGGSCEDEFDDPLDSTLSLEVEPSDPPDWDDDPLA